jgi:hypothetical protein
MPYACPRSWEAAVRLRAEVDSEELADMLTEGAIGPGVTSEFASWRREADLPDPEDVITAPEQWEPCQGRADRTLAVLLSVVGAVTGKPTDQRYRASAVCLVSAAQSGQAGVALVAGRHLMQNKDIQAMKEPRELGELEKLIDADLL